MSITGHHQPLTARVSGAWYRSLSGGVLSVGVHVACLLGLIVISHSDGERRPRLRTSLTFAPVSLAVPVDALAMPEPARHVARPLELPPQAHAPAPVEDAGRKAEPLEPVKLMPVTHDAELPEPPTSVAVPSVQNAPEPTVRVGAFEAVTAVQSKARQTVAVMPAGFGDAGARGAMRALAITPVAAAGFDREAAPPPPVVTAVAPVPAFNDSSIEILFKPKPRYTEEAEALGIQGTVVLEVEFTASNDIRVLRVVRKLGHGLDEAAIEAAGQIRFKPARRQGVAVDSRVTVQIEFRLS